ncbi:hypothetical protein M0R45_016043 [Rubus argutus]|uniref:Uncharacterized protein n=1 Tax=Rubus argutus TaxID=59490 RepID=A0AAW1XQX6_RUBAR
MSPAEKTTAEDWKLAAAGTDLGGVGELICQNCSWARYRENDAVALWESRLGRSTTTVAGSDKESKASG